MKLAKFRRLDIYFPASFALLGLVLAAVVLLISVPRFGWDPWLAAALVGVAGLAGVPGWLVSRVIIHRLEAMKIGVAAMADGNPNAIPETAAFHELSGLAEELRRVGGLLDQRRGELSDQIRVTYHSELAAEKQRMEAFFKGIGDGISIVDPDMRIIFVNDAIRNIFGDYTGEFCYRIYEHKTAVCGGCPVKKAMETGEVHHSLRRVFDKDGRLRYYESTGSPIRDERGTIVAGIELARDVTQRIKLERNVEIRSRELADANRELRAANEQLQRAFEELKATQSRLMQSEKMASLGVLVAGVAHEINNPLNFVSASIKLMNEHIQALQGLYEFYESMPLPPDDRSKLEELKEQIEYDYLMEDLSKNVKNISTGADRMKQIVQNLRTFSRLDSGEKVPVDVPEGIESTLQMLFYEYKDRIEIERSYGKVPRIIGSPGKLNQVFMNIIHNAIQAIDGKGKITISVQQQKDSVQVAIRDSGPGIPADVMPHVFDPFFTTKKVGQGTGLGLSISYGIVEDHGGKLWVESEEGLGTTFYIGFPIGPPSEPPRG